MLHATRTGEPSIGQLEYLKYLQAMSGVQKPSFVVIGLDLPACTESVIHKAILLLLKRHEALRTVFPVVDNKIIQIVLPVCDNRFDPLRITIAGTTSLSEIKKTAFDSASMPFSDIGQGPLTRCIIFTKEQKSSLWLLIHHVLCDEWSRGIIKDELKYFIEAYSTGNEPQLHQSPITLIDYCMHQNTWLQKNKGLLHSFWTNKLKDFNAVFEINAFHRIDSAGERTGFNRFGKPRSLDLEQLNAILDRPDALSYTRILSPASLADLEETASTYNIQLSTLVYSSLFLFLYAYTGNKYLLVPALIPDRFLPEHQNLVGCLLGSIYLAIHIQESSPISRFWKDIEQEIKTASRHIIFSHQFLDLDGDRIRNYCNMYINYFEKEEDLTPHLLPTEHQTEDYAISYPIYCMITRYNNALVFTWKYNHFLFDALLIEDMTAYFEKLIRYTIANPGSRIGQLRNLSKTTEAII